jgi:hypothetical protein
MLRGSPLLNPVRLRAAGTEYRIVARHELVFQSGEYRLLPAFHLVRTVEGLRRGHPDDVLVLNQLLQAAGIRKSFSTTQPNVWNLKRDSVIRAIEEGKLVGWEEVTHHAVLRPDVKPDEKPIRPDDKPSEEPKKELNSVSLTLESSYFAPEVEELAIGFRITGPLKQVTGLRLKMVRDAEPGKYILNQVLPIDEASGSFRWKGEVAGFADGFITLKDSPYELQLFMETTNGKVESNKQRLSVLPHEIHVRVDDLPAAKIDAKHLKSIQKLKKDLHEGRPGKLVHESPIFKTSVAEMNNSASFDTYKAAMGRGIPVPLFARVRVLGKDGTGKRSPKALHQSKLLWEVSHADDKAFERAMDDRGVHPTAKKFQTKVTAHKKDDTQPKGRNCHLTLGGERAKAADRGSDLQWKELDAGWKVSKPARRVWDCHSTLAKQKDDDSGVLFVGGRIAGDSYSVRAYLDSEGTFDKEDDAVLRKADRAFKSNVLSWTHWRRVDVSKMYKVGASTPELSIPAVNASFQEAAMNVELKPGITTEEIQTRWKEEYQKVLASDFAADPFIKHAALDDPGNHPCRFRDFADYRKLAHPLLNKMGEVGKRLMNFMSSMDEETYKETCSDYSMRIYMSVVQAFSLGDNGLTLFNFGGWGAHNQPPTAGIVVGIAPDIPKKSGRNKAAFLMFAAGQSGSTLIHEIGHHLFLAHAPGHYTPGEQPGGYQPNAHDEGEFCVMSYHSSEPNVFCGLCQLKLMGWDYAKISKTGQVS